MRYLTPDDARDECLSLEQRLDRHAGVHVRRYYYSEALVEHPVSPDRTTLGHVPTVDLTIHFRRDLPVPGARPDDFVLATFRSRFAEQGFIEEDGEIWTRDGTLLAQSRQLAVIG